MDLDTFLTTLYVLVDDWYKNGIEAQMKRRGGGKQRMSDSEVLTVALAGQWRVGVPWQSERGIVRYLQQHGREWFPGMLGKSAFNERVRLLWQAFVQLQQVVAEMLQSRDESYECVDCVPLSSCSVAQAGHEGRHWLWLSRFGHGGTQGTWFFGDQLLVAVSASGVVSGWLVGDAHSDDRWLLEAFLSARAGQPQLQAPVHRKRDARWQRSQPPLAQHMRAFAAVGQPSACPYLVDRGFNGLRWQRHWLQAYGATVISVPPDNVQHPWSRADKRWLSSHRQIIETVFARLEGTFMLKRLQAHSYWGQLTRIAAKLAAYNIGLYLNHLLGRPAGALATLVC